MQWRAEGKAIGEGQALIEAFQEGDVIGPAEAALAKLVMLAEVKAVVRGENDGGILEQVEVLDAVKQVAKPCIHHGDFAAVSRVGHFNILAGQAIVFVIPVGGVHLPPIVTGQVLLDVVSGRVPGFVWVPGVDIKEEMLLGVTFQPIGCAFKGARSKTATRISNCFGFGPAEFVVLRKRGAPG